MSKTQGFYIALWGTAVGLLGSFFFKYYKNPEVFTQGELLGTVMMILGVIIQLAGLIKMVR